MHAEEDVLQHVVGLMARAVQQPRRLALQRPDGGVVHDRQRVLVARREAGEEGAVLGCGEMR